MVNNNRIFGFGDSDGGLMTKCLTDDLRYALGDNNGDELPLLFAPFPTPREAAPLVE